MGFDTPETPCHGHGSCWACSFDVFPCGDVFVTDFFYFHHLFYINRAEGESCYLESPCLRWFVMFTIRLSMCWSMYILYQAVGIVKFSYPHIMPKSPYFRGFYGDTTLVWTTTCFILVADLAFWYKLEIVETISLRDHQSFGEQCFADIRKCSSDCDSQHLRDQSVPFCI